MTRMLVLLLLGLLTVAAEAQDEIALFDGRGEAIAYVAADDDSTLYMWSGKPVAYLDEDRSGGFHLYGFNGKHLGWFVKGVVWDHRGRVACATKDRLPSAQFEPFKAFKEFKPFKAFKEFSPLRPLFSEFWSDTPCRLLLARGGA